MKKHKLKESKKNIGLTRLREYWLNHHTLESSLEWYSREEIKENE